MFQQNAQDMLKKCHLKQSERRRFLECTELSSSFPPRVTKNYWALTPSRIKERATNFGAGQG